VIARKPPGRVEVLTLQDPGYPAALRAIADPPQALYVRGRLVEADRMAVAVVGARRASPYGVAVGEWLGRELARSGVTVVSGLARGIDAAAHRGALAAGGRTVAVLGCGVDVAYPPDHARLLAQVVEAGAALSEYPLGTPPLRYHFPRRNRLISGLCLGVVVVEGQQDSGALITADSALEQGREVFAVPGPIFAATSALPHRLLQQGAKLVTGVEDILDELHLPLRPVRRRASAPELAGTEAAVYAHLTLDPLHIDAVALRCGVPVPEVGRTLLVLEMRGLVQALPGQRYVRAALEDEASGPVHPRR